jgi:peptidoglycan biosynthesis protein MviN/MurJ (putative lipid II flippase)
MFPKFSKELPRGSNQLAVAACVLLNFGLILRIVAEPLQACHPVRTLGWLFVLSAVAQWLVAHHQGEL